MVLVLVEWNDAFSIQESWIGKDGIDSEPMKTLSVGLLLEDAKPNHVVIAQSFNDDDSYDSILCIPVAIVTRLAVISEGDVRTPSPHVVG